jgi:hypothetical protein
METLTIETSLHSGTYDAVATATDRTRTTMAYLADTRTAEELAHRRRQRCKSLPPLGADEARLLMAAFVASKSVTTCPARYAAPSAQGSVNKTQ